MVMRLLNFLKPNFIKLLVAFILVFTTVFVIVHREATSKVSWEQLRGIPYPFLVLTENRGPCLPDNIFCVEVYFQKIYPIEMLVNTFIWYFVSCVIIGIFERVKNRYEVRGFVTQLI